jgi:thiol-disulfide isomerase/thioredoxin
MDENFSRTEGPEPMKEDKRHQRALPLSGLVGEGQVVRALACLVVLLVAFVLVPGCALFNKKSTDTKTPATAAGTPPAKFPTSTDPLLNGGNVSQAYGGAVLAGRVFDNYSKPPANTSIRLVGMDGKEASKDAKDVDVSPDGYFIIQGLKPGADYKLLARGKNGDHVLAGMTYAKAPNLTVVIQVKEDFATSATPDVPGSPAFQDKNPAKTSALDNPYNNAAGQSGQGGGEFQLPTVNVPVPGPTTSSPTATNQGWVPSPNVAMDRGSVLPRLEIPNPTVKPAPPPLFIPKTEPQLPTPVPPPSLPGDSRLGGPALVPSCVLVGTQLINFALNDVNGEPWEFKRNHRGKLLLIDFWRTDCIPCVKSIPALVQLQAKYGSQGLEVIGIAVESGGSAQEQAYRVDSKARTLGINYRQLVSGSAFCPVRTSFNVKFVPTTVLVDQDGTIVWRQENNKLDELERLIQRKLGSR